MAKNDKKEEEKSGVPAVQEEKGTAVAQHALADMYAADAGAGLENIRIEDTRIPTLKILQGLSPELAEGDPKYIEGAKQGMFLHSVTRQLYDGKEGVMIIPVHFHKQWVEWRPRQAGGGFVAAYDSREDALAQVKEGNEIQETANHFLLIRDENNHWVPIVLQAKSTMLGFSRSFNAMMQSLRIDVPGRGPVQPPSFAAIYNLSTARQQNDKGAWYTIVAERVSMVEDPAIYAEAKAFRQSLVQGGDIGARIRQDDDAPRGGGKPSDKDSVTGEQLPEM
jgi:hypothetical protein